MTEEFVTAHFPRNHLIEFGGLPVVEFTQTAATTDLRAELADAVGAGHQLLQPSQESARLSAALADPGSVAWWLEFNPENTCASDAFAVYLDRFLATARTEPVTALVVGGHIEMGTEPQAVVDALVERRDRFPNLRALFLSEIDDDQISDVDDTAVGALAMAFPNLRELTVCLTGGTNFDPIEHSGLRRLVWYSDCLYPEVIASIAGSELPALEYLELWNGETFAESREESEHAAFEALCHTTTLPRLHHLGLRGFTFAEEIAAQLAGTPLRRQLTALRLDTVDQRG
ncbi:hypothetical protein JK358_29715 [Nocardia sp. 2]|uniref:Leucine-rich repeat domain-containing protein n=1 Tax=Nocardia acididurans TaxID=2802282 RepID=A0ABS1MD49_9NOCA|nr:hypothetical protein [Nocardia acididurans]MBL1078590.1 hypothetical protein [Nocardia acididurans]